MTVVEAGQDGLAGGVDDARLRATVFQRRRIVTDCYDALALDRQRLGYAKLPVYGDNLRVVDDQIGVAGGGVGVDVEMFQDCESREAGEESDPEKPASHGAPRRMDMLVRLATRSA